MLIVYVLGVIPTYSFYTCFRPPSIVLKLPPVFTRTKRYARTRKCMKDTSTYIGGMKIEIFFERFEKQIFHSELSYIQHNLSPILTIVSFNRSLS